MNTNVLIGAVRIPIFTLLGAIPEAVRAAQAVAQDDHDPASPGGKRVTAEEVAQAVGAFCAALLGAFMHRDPWIAYITLAISGSGIGWALFDRDRQFLYDRLAGTRLVLAKPE